ncbi:MAG: 16S rRNA (uracil(1498)-N(3))-methyltransferase [Flavobacteriales bacterium]|nr:16S rRNA (uracil(1498)-N(3))-methyltransferase [Flavobacteriales bacterium]
MQLFYATSIQKGTINLDPEESRHLAKVLRLTTGDRVSAIDGLGNQYVCEVLSAHPKNSVLTILEKTELKESFKVSIAAAPTKNLNRWEWFLEKATEIGIDEIYPFKSYHSERKLLKHDRQERILISAMKQSYKATLPKLSELTPFKNLIEQSFDHLKYIAHCYEDIPRESLKQVHPKGQKALILIGPEGDFSKEEVELAIAKGFKSVSLSESRLRTETAALVACHTIHLINA